MVTTVLHGCEFIGLEESFPRKFWNLVLLVYTHRVWGCSLENFGNFDT